MSGTTSASNVYRIVVHLNMSKKRLREDFLKLSIVREFDINKNREEIEKFIRENYHATEVTIDEFPEGQVDLILTFDNVDQLGKIAGLITRYQKEIYIVPASETLSKKTFVIDNSIDVWVIKFTTSYKLRKYVNTLVFIPNTYSYGVVRILEGSKTKLAAFERQTALMIGAKERHGAESDKIFRFNNYLISDKGLRSEEVKVHESHNATKVFSDVHCLKDVRDRALISSIGIMTRDLKVLPWPLTTFQLASDDTTLYSMFVARFKAKSLNKGRLGQAQTGEVLELNYDSETSELKVELEAKRLATLESEKVISVTAVTYPSLSKGRVKPEQNYVGLFMVKAFHEVISSPVYLLHLFEDEKLINEIKQFQGEIVRKLEASLVDYRKLTKSVIAMAMDRVRQTNGLCRPWEPDWELVEHNAEALQLYYEVYDRLTKGGLKPKSPEAGD
ncbi:MAG: hypothetical protein ACP5IE_08525, partial [Infirmifilum sp.]